MSNSLRDQLMGLGYQPAPKPERKPESPGQGARQPHSRPQSRPQPKPHGRAPGKPRDASGTQPAPKSRVPGPPRTREEIDLGKAYALRAQKEKDDRIEAERIKQEAARVRREAKAKLTLLLAGKGLNDAAAEIARHFEYGGKIKRIHVTAEQLVELNAGRLGVVQVDGRYLLLPAALVAEAESVFADAVALKVDPDAPQGDDPYGDPAYQVPDDLVW